MADAQRTVVFAIYPDATLLDFAGSLQVFTTASDIVEEATGVRVGSGDLKAGAGTRLFGALDKVLADVSRRRLAGIVLITDGQVHDVPKSLKEASRGAPIHVLLSGEKNAGDRRLK